MFQETLFLLTRYKCIHGRTAIDNNNNNNGDDDFIVLSKTTGFLSGYWQDIVSGLLKKRTSRLEIAKLVKLNDWAMRRKLACCLRTSVDSLK